MHSGSVQLTSENGDGVFAYIDEYALLLMRALQDAGVDVPARPRWWVPTTCSSASCCGRA